ncbi:Wzz/FepE/Etk N-terminal domain-containing protein [Desulfuromonas sp. TF]|uniref:Wzz/FepE/Etk N-terminal domain-containing protein n=1 Tax=Desulfuromonas sp. TF TaxID=1232410 RepID=UPI0009DDB8DE|nr:Wzz/FepE/Etk N-terminal domain-containing protein [Desulfuromonas sp. TF]
MLVAEDEIELIDLFRIIWKRRNLIIFGTLIAVIAAAGIAFLLPKVYEVSAILEPGTRPISNDKGQIVDEKNVVSPESLKVSILGGAYDQTIREKLNIPADKFPKFKVTTPQQTNLVKITIESSHPDEALVTLRELVAVVAAGIQEKLEVEKGQVGNEIKLARIEEEGLAKRIELIETQIGETQGKIGALLNDRQKSMARNPSDAMSVLLYSNEIQNQQIYLNDLQERLRELQTTAEGSGIRLENLQLKMASIKSTRLAKSPGISPKHIRPKKPLIVALALIMSAMVMTMAAFFLEYLEQHRIILKGRSEVLRSNVVPSSEA